MPTKKRELERALEYKAIAYAEAHGWIAKKLEKCGRGWPDRIFFGPDKSLLIVEFKRPGEKPRPQQESVHRKLAALGHPVRIIDSLPDFERLIDAAL